jgi:hypothetical protein
MFIERRAEKTFGALFARDKKRFWDKFSIFRTLPDEVCERCERKRCLFKKGGGDEELSSVVWNRLFIAVTSIDWELKRCLQLIQLFMGVLGKGQLCSLLIQFHSMASRPPQLQQSPPIFNCST